MLLFGGRLVVPVVIVVSAFTVFIVAAIALENANCYVRICISIAMSVASGILAVCAVRVGLMVAGFALASGSVHITVLALPISDALRTHSLYYVGLCVVGMAGAAFVRWNKRLSFILLSSAIGGTGIGYTVHSFAVLSGVHIPNYIFVGVGIAGTAAGTCFQRRNIAKKEQGANAASDDVEL